MGGDVDPSFEWLDIHFNIGPRCDLDDATDSLRLPGIWSETLTISALLLLPGLLALLPCWELGWIDVSNWQPTFQNRLNDATEDDHSSERRNWLSPRMASSHRQNYVLNGKVQTARPSAAAFDGTGVDSSKQRHSLGAHVVDPPDIETRFFFRWTYLGRILGWIYLTGVAVGFIRLIVDYRNISNLIAESTNVSERRFTEAMSSCLQKLSLSRRIACRMTERLKVPAVAGVYRPVILLPMSSIDWPAERLTAALGHELAHVARHDLPIQLMVRIVRIVYWAQPLICLLSKMIGNASEAASDDIVIGRIIRPTEYAKHLLAVAAALGQGSSTSQAILAMAHCSKIERRIVLILSATQNRIPPARRVKGWTLTLSTICLLMSVLLNPLARAMRSEAAAQDDPASRLNNAANADSRLNEVASADANEAGVKVMRGRVVDEAGKAVSGAQLWLPLQREPRRTAHSVTDDSGRFELKFAADWISPRVAGQLTTIWAYAPGYSIETQNVYAAIHAGDEKEIEITLPPQGNTQFKVLSPEGHPLPDLMVYPQTYHTARAYEFVPEEMLAVVSARTDKDGVATLTAIRPQPLYQVRIESGTYGKQSLSVDRDPEAVLRNIRLRNTGSIKGRLVGDHPEWLRGVRLVFKTDNQDEWYETNGMAEAVTDADGCFEVPVIAGGPLEVTFPIAPSIPARPVLSRRFYVSPGESVALEIPVKAAPLVTGQVRAKPSGKPVVNAELVLGIGNGDLQNSQLVVTNERGIFEGHVLPGRVKVQIIFLPDRLVQLGETDQLSSSVPSGVDAFTLPTIDVVGSREVTGRLVGDKDQPLQQMGVVAFKGNRYFHFAKTNSDGRFTLNVPDGVETRIKVAVPNQDFESVAVVGQDPLIVRYIADTTREAMEAERKEMADVVLTGRTLSDGVPQAGVTLILRREVPVRDGASGLLELIRTETDAQGRYRLPGLKANDRYTIDVKPPFRTTEPVWRYRSIQTSRLPDDAKGEFELPDLNLRKLNQSLAGIVVDRDGKPVEGVYISAHFLDNLEPIRFPFLSRSLPSPTTISDREGRFQLKQLPDELLAIAAEVNRDPGDGEPPHTWVSADLNQQDIRIVLDASRQGDAKK
jgi:beta-lactamase regulating signal transducer with metallopeptidase domain